ncbi:Site-specific recombinase XerD [Muriicola jejuensis]|uniref:Tyrosine-type recombinase/integrase n=1 Tax=Muriicola jejuensis TaxID=504488 RepID=A0A6P0UBZ8_9FLAO|nr:site-specific integrase [Muriicola jejuensis]NER10020.1 tyrosine-type recombinase/integrase [Muriicola jejuensis]SMP03714.1 Site-specific recombinase XerD [Muriicola jejuensis]
MKQKTLSILFYLQKVRTNKSGVCPIRCRITYLGKRKEFTTGEFISPRQWMSKKQKASPGELKNEQINLQLEIIASNLKKEFLQVQLQKEDFSVQDIYDAYFKVTEKRKEAYVIDYFQEFLQKQRRLIGIDLQLGTWKKFNYAHKQARDYIKWKFGQHDLPMKELNLQFLHDFEYYLKTERSQSQITINKCIQRFRKPIRIAVAEEYIKQDPFMLYKPGRVKKEVVFLTQEELTVFENHTFKQPRLELVKNLFVFCCYTGLPYNEMANLRQEHLVNGFDGNQWIKMKRGKTGKLVSVPLLPKAKTLLYLYQNDSEFLLPRISNQKINSYLKEIAGILGIKKRITHHTARKTFASIVLLNNNVSMEIVSELLGHSSIKITQEYYGKIVQKRVSEEMRRIAKELK